jgi:hypothetical protein
VRGHAGRGFNGGAVRGMVLALARLAGNGTARIQLANDRRRRCGV